MVRVFLVNFKFRTLGDVFTKGLRRAAHELGVESANTHWDDPALEQKITAFEPDAVFVVHGRNFAQRRIKLKAPSAVWLVDEPYETDNTVKWSSYFDTVFINDPVTLTHHKNAHYLPTAYDPKIHNPGNAQRSYNTGFIGGSNPMREAALSRLASKGFLSYVVGPWRPPDLARLCLSPLLSPEETATLYQRTKLSINVFRTQNTYNSKQIIGVAPNPRVFEALACGSLVISEWRPEIERMFPALPTFRDIEGLVEHVSTLLNDETKHEAMLKQCMATISEHSYARRLYKALATMGVVNDPAAREDTKWPTQSLSSPTSIDVTEPGAAVLPDTGSISNEPDPTLMKSVAMPPVVVDAQQTNMPTRVWVEESIPDLIWSPNKDEQVSTQSFTTVELSCEINVATDAVFVAKIHQQEQFNSSSDSYHVVYGHNRTYLAKHNKVLARFTAPRDKWHKLTLRCNNPKIEVLVDGSIVAAVTNIQLQNGFCALSSTGAVEIKNIVIRDLFIASVKNQFSTLTSNRQAPVAPRQMSAMHVPFTRTPIRNLIYHIWPVKNSMWQWNIDQLLRRIDMFNGRRIIAIVHDVKSDDPNEVIAKFNGHGCEFIVQPNGIGEADTFGIMLKRIRSTDPNEVTFYAHAKGVKYGAGATDQIRRWAELLYRFNLDDWRTVRAHLDKFPLTGAMRMLGQFDSHHRLNTWHYSGTFFWIRHALAFSHGALNIQRFYGGVEAWPGMHFRQEDTGCIALDNLRQVLPYAPQFWITTGDAGVRQWEAARRGYGPPTSLQHPPAYLGFTTPRLEQHPEEMAWFMEALLERKPERILTIGAKHGGLEWHIARAFREAGHDIDITTVEIDPVPQVKETFNDIRTRFKQKVTLIHSDSMAPNLATKLQGSYDAAFIDGHHTYYAASSDWNLARSLGAKFIGLHDIVDSDWHAAAHCCVSKLWAEIKKQEKRTDECMVGDWGGIGCAWVDSTAISAPAPITPRIAIAPSVAVIVGGAACVWDDLKALGEIPNARYFVINDTIELFSGPCSVVSLHPPKIPGWLAKRRAAGYPEPDEIWSHTPGTGITKVTREWTPMSSSGGFAIKVVREQGFKHIVLCGVPMQADLKHIKRGVDWGHCDFFLVGFKVRLKEMAPYVRSMSGWTREQLGAPDAAFLGLESVKVLEQA